MENDHKYSHNELIVMNHHTSSELNYRIYQISRLNPIKLVSVVLFALAICIVIEEVKMLNFILYIVANLCLTLIFFFELLSNPTQRIKELRWLSEDIDSLTNAAEKERTRYWYDNYSRVKRRYTELGLPPISDEEVFDPRRVGLKEN